MTKQRNKIVELTNTSVAAAFDKETQLLKQIQTNQLEQVLLLWRTTENTLVLPASNKWQNSDELEQQLRQLDWQILSRKTGGAPVPQTSGVINLSHIYLWQEQESYSILKAYNKLCDTLALFFASFGVKTEVHATEYSYCDGDYNLNINGKKVVGTAQRVLLKNGGGSIVLVQACILIDAVMEHLIEPVKLCYQHNYNSDVLKADVHTCLFQHIEQKPDTQLLFQALTKAFATRA